MRNSRALALTVCFCLLLISSLAKADPVCVATNLSTLAFGGPCTIGDKTVNFTQVSFALEGFSGLDLSSFQFIPDASNPLSPSFTIAAASGTGVTLPAGSDADLTVVMSFTVSTTNGSPTLSGLDLSLSGNVHGAGNSLPTRLQAGFQNLSTAVSGGDPFACLQNGGPFLVTGCVLTNGAGVQSDSGSFAPPIASESGQAFLELDTDSTGVATLTSAVFSFNEVPNTNPVPEPGSLMLLGSGLIGAAGAVRRRISR